jgi:class 3 adenylate cyclase
LVAVSESAPASILLAATCPERVRALVLYGAMARATADEDYIWAKPREAFVEASRELVLPHWGQGATAEIVAPSVADDPQARGFFARLERQGASPAMAHAMFRAFLETDVRQVLSTIAVPTLVLHRRGDRVVDVRAGRWLASQIPGSRYVEQPGIDHCPWIGDAGSLAAEIEEFLTGTAHEAELDRVLLTVLFVDLVASSDRVVALGDRRWRDTLEEFYGIVRRHLIQFRGREIDTIRPSVRTASAILHAHLIARAGPSKAAKTPSPAVVRSGLHTGECEVLGNKLGGIAVHIGARVAAEAEPNEVVVSSTVKDLVAGSGLRFNDRGVRALKGIPGEWRLFAVGRD